MKTLFPVLALAWLLTGCASPISLSLDQSGKPAVLNNSGKELHDVSLKIGAGCVNGREAFEEMQFDTWKSGEWRHCQTIQLNGIAYMVARGGSREIKNFRESWQAPWTQISVTTVRY